MQSMCQHVPLLLQYQVHFTTGLFAPDHPLLARLIAGDGGAAPHRVLVAIDQGLLDHQPDLWERVAAYVETQGGAITLAGSPIVLPGGEAAKNDPRLIEQLHRAVHEHGICRHSYIMAIGGGAVLDAVGYAAATAHRGIRLIRVPTTVLAQNDAAVGVKNSVNAYGKKNFLGTFAPPYAVLNDFAFLETLPERDWRSGIAEAVKVALIKDPGFFEALECAAPALARRDMTAMQSLIYRCAALHLEHIAGSGDPFEQGSSRPLDFGHWAAHKLEQLTDYALRHGEAVAIGIALDSAYSHLEGRLSAAALERILGLLGAVGFTLSVPELAEYLDEPDHPRCLFRGLQEFQEHLGGELTIMLLNDIGRGVEVHEVDTARYAEAVALLSTWPSS
jgi:3-dehydroquinate synthase